MNEMRQAHAETCREERHQLRKRILELQRLSRLQRNTKHLDKENDKTNCYDETTLPRRHDITISRYHDIT